MIYCSFDLKGLFVFIIIDLIVFCMFCGQERDLKVARFSSPILRKLMPKFCYRDQVTGEIKAKRGFLYLREGEEEWHFAYWFLFDLVPKNSKIIWVPEKLPWFDSAIEELFGSNTYPSKR